MEGHAADLPDQQGEDPTAEPRGGTKSHRRSNSYTYTTLEVGMLLLEHGLTGLIVYWGGCGVGEDVQHVRLHRGLYVHAFVFETHP